jgi:hypothetical protein
MSQLSLYNYNTFTIHQLMFLYDDQRDISQKLPLCWVPDAMLGIEVQWIRYVQIQLFLAPRHLYPSTKFIKNKERLYP